MAKSDWKKVDGQWVRVGSSTSSKRRARWSEPEAREFSGRSREERAWEEQMAEARAWDAKNWERNPHGERYTVRVTAPGWPDGIEVSAQVVLYATCADAVDAAYARRVKAGVWSYTEGLPASIQAPPALRGKPILIVVERKDLPSKQARLREIVAKREPNHNPRRRNAWGRPHLGPVVGKVGDLAYFLGVNGRMVPIKVTAVTEQVVKGVVTKTGMGYSKGDVLVEPHHYMIPRTARYVVGGKYRIKSYTWAPAPTVNGRARRSRR